MMRVLVACFAFHFRVCRDSRRVSKWLYDNKRARWIWLGSNNNLSLTWLLVRVIIYREQFCSCYLLLSQVVEMSTSFNVFVKMTTSSATGGQMN